LPGGVSHDLVFRDVRNRKIRLHYLSDEKRLVSERFQNGVYVSERTSKDVSEGQGIQIDQCENSLFTVLTPSSVLVNFTTFDDRVKETYETIICLSNTKLDQ